MAKLFRLLGILAAFLLTCGTRANAQDIAVRVEAIRLMERAHSVSHPSHRMPNHKQDLTFRAYGLDGTTKDGQSSTIISGDIERYETHFGDYNGTSIHYPDKIVQDKYQPPPPEILEMGKLTPLLLAWFDKSDIINSITPATLFGRAAKCVQFETVNGRTHESNELCVDEELGVLVRYNVGDDLIENTDFVSFENIMLPQHIRHYINGRLRMEIEQKFSVIEGPIDWAALTPPNPTTLRTCRPYVRPVIQSAPQPANAGAGPWYDVQIHGVIGSDGHVHEAAVLPAGRPDLEKQAIDLVSTWVFSPPTCSGKPTVVNADLVVHFPPQ
ncbi:MAG TPA: hypothetical protein VJW94_06895 [Candidatus Acidoferrum sp.]|nr:hypothetical protein [Candidatus Acidoferrum sp.]